MEINGLRIYCEVYEQGLETRDYLTAILREIGTECGIDIIYAKKTRGEFLLNESIVSRIRKIKDIDIMITVISDDKEIPLVLLEYSTAVPTDDHIMQRSDVMYWSARFKVPSIKISPLNKGMTNAHGGGEKITDSFEKRVAMKNNAVYYTFKWECNEGKDVLAVNEARTSCIPYSEDLKSCFSKLIRAFTESTGHSEYYDCLLDEYIGDNQDIYGEISQDEIFEMFPPSKRFTWTPQGLTVKINRFGHAMDPERGVIYFCSMMNGVCLTAAEFQVERSSVNGRGGYNALFDMTPNKKQMLEYVSAHGNGLTAEEALHVFLSGLGIDKYFKTLNISDGTVELDSDELLGYLKNANGFSLKSIFILSRDIVLTNKSRELLLTVKYDRKVIDDYIHILDSCTYGITPIRPMTQKDINEDIVTYASAVILKRAGMMLPAVSYPGAQGDRCILVGEGRNVDRKYIDIIACRESDDHTLNVILHESKESISSSSADIEKLNAIVSSEEQCEALKKLMLKLVGSDKISDINIGIGGSGTELPTDAAVNHIMLFNIENADGETRVVWSIAAKNTSLLWGTDIPTDQDGVLRGTICLDAIYCIE